MHGGTNQRLKTALRMASPRCAIMTEASSIVSVVQGVTTIKCTIVVQVFWTAFRS